MTFNAEVVKIFVQPAITYNRAVMVVFAPSSDCADSGNVSPMPVELN
jgi:hypothetical protein